MDQKSETKMSIHSMSLFFIPKLYEIILVYDEN